MKRGTFKKKNWKPLKRTPFTVKAFKPLRRTRLRVAGTSSTSELKREAQSILRAIVISRDKGCILRNYENELNPQYRECGGYRKDGEMILQAEHLHTRSNASSFADTRLVICLCQRHHIYYKPQHSDEYYRIVRKHIGKERSDLLDRVQQDRSPHKQDLRLDILALKQELKKYEKKTDIQ